MLLFTTHVFAAFFSDLLICQNAVTAAVWTCKNHGQGAVSHNGIFTSLFRSALLRNLVTLTPFMFCLQDDGWLMGILELSGIKGVFPANFTKKM